MAERINKYTCPKGHDTVTIDIDKGVTPFMIDCKHEGCKELAKSSFYRVEANLVPTFEWYKPETMEGLNIHELDHVERGGLLLRERITRSTNKEEF